MLKKTRARLLKSIGIGLGVFLVIYIGFSIYGAKESMEIPRLPLAYAGEALGVPYEDVSFYGRIDDVLLKGWFVPGQNSQVIIIIHGGFQNRIDDNVNTLGLTRDLVDKGYNILLYDLRGRGESEGKGQALSYIEEDVGGAVDYLKYRGYGTDSIYILGFCSGAYSACIYASQNDIGKVILDGCFIDVMTMVARQAQSVGIPVFLEYVFWPGGLLFTHWMYGFNVVNPIDVVFKINCPILFIHEENDEFITLDEVQRLFLASTNPANRIWEVSSANHSQGYKVHPQEYIEKVDTFLSIK